MTIEVRTTSLDSSSTAIGAAHPFTLTIDRPSSDGGGGLGFNGAQLLYLAVAGCVSNDLYREAARQGIALRRVEVTVRGDFADDPAVSTDVTYDVNLSGDAPQESLRELVTHVDAIAEVPNSLRRGTAVRLGVVDASPTPGASTTT